MNFATPQRTLMSLRLLPLFWILFWPGKDSHSVKAGFHMFADDCRSRKVLRSSAIIWKHTSAIVWDHMETKVLRSAIETYPIIVLVLTDDSTFLSHKALIIVYSNAYLF